MFRLLSSLLLVLALGGAASCNQDKPESASLVGAWDVVSIDNQAKKDNITADLGVALLGASGLTQVVFTAQNQIEVLDKDGKQISSGTYSVNGDRIDTKMTDRSDSSPIRFEAIGKDEMKFIGEDVSITAKRAARRL